MKLPRARYGCLLCCKRQSSVEKICWSAALRTERHRGMASHQQARSCFNSFVARCGLFLERSLTSSASPIFIYNPQQVCS